MAPSSGADCRGWTSPGQRHNEFLQFRHPADSASTYERAGLWPIRAHLGSLGVDPLTDVKRQRRLGSTWDVVLSLADVYSSADEH